MIVCRANQRGLSLLSLMAGLVIFSILTAIALPNYHKHVTKARRDTAQAALLTLAQQMHGLYSDFGSYMPDDTAPVLPFTQAPIHGPKAFYDLTLSSIANQSFVLRATPKGVQAEDGYLEITQTGQRRWDANNSGSIEANERDW